MDRIAIIERGIEGMSVYFIKVSYSPNLGLDDVLLYDSRDSSPCTMICILEYFFQQLKTQLKISTEGNIIRLFALIEGFPLHIRHTWTLLLVNPGWVVE
jgi:hypothetical protein